MKKSPPLILTMMIIALFFVLSYYIVFYNLDIFSGNVVEDPYSSPVPFCGDNFIQKHLGEECDGKSNPCSTLYKDKLICNIDESKGELCKCIEEIKEIPEKPISPEEPGIPEKPISPEKETPQSDCNSYLNYNSFLKNLPKIKNIEEFLDMFGKSYCKISVQKQDCCGDICLSIYSEASKKPEITIRLKKTEQGEITDNIYINPTSSNLCASLEKCSLRCNSFKQEINLNINNEKTLVLKKHQETEQEILYKLETKDIFKISSFFGTEYFASISYNKLTGIIALKIELKKRTHFPFVWASQDVYESQSCYPIPSSQIMFSDNAEKPISYEVLEKDFCDD